MFFALNSDLDWICLIYFWLAVIWSLLYKFHRWPVNSILWHIANLLVLGNFLLLRLLAVLDFTLVSNNFATNLWRLADGGSHIVHTGLGLGNLFEKYSIFSLFEYFNSLVIDKINSYLLAFGNLKCLASWWVLFPYLVSIVFNDPVGVAHLLSYIIAHCLLQDNFSAPGKFFLVVMVLDLALVKCLYVWCIPEAKFLNAGSALNPN